MKLETTIRRNYQKPAIQEIEMEDNEQLMRVSNYDGAETD